MAAKAKLFIYSNEIKGEVKLNNFDLIEEDLRPLKDGEFLAEALYISVDPYQKTLIVNAKIGTTMFGRQIARVTESKCESYPKDSIIFGNFGWRSHTIADPAKFPNKYDLYLLPDLDGLPNSLALGVLGMPGNSAYYGFLELCQPKEGETVVVTAAAGAVGSLVGQIAKIKGCKVIGFAGSDEKCKWLEDELGFDKAINYKTSDNVQALKEAAPEGVDCYFDNVGGMLSYNIIDQMRLNGRISVCGAISGYNGEQIMVPAFQTFHRRHLKMEGFMNYRWIHRWMDEGMFEMLKWVQEGKIKYQETITEGFENTLQAFIDMMGGKNFGKAIVKV